MQNALGIGDLVGTEMQFRSVDWKNEPVEVERLSPEGENDFLRKELITLKHKKIINTQSLIVFGTMAFLGVEMLVLGVALAKTAFSLYGIGLIATVFASFINSAQK